MNWTCGGESIYELGLPTRKAVWSLYDRPNIFLDPSMIARDARVVPYITPCMGDLYHSPVSDGSLVLMKGWIDDCQHRHQLCMETPQQIGRPKRLLQCLSKSDGFVRLVETTQRCDYIALSYCWGNVEDPLTTRQETTNGVPPTLERHQLGIPDESLQPLHQEVVALARGLGIGYLWIDALCIIQDSTKDQDEEIRKMDDIYRGALVVVVAARGRSPLDSLLSVKPQPGQSHTWRTASRIRYEEMDFDVKFRERDTQAHVYAGATYGTPIARRAWCFQEKMLASRLTMRWYGSVDLVADASAAESKKTSLLPDTRG